MKYIMIAFAVSALQLFAEEPQKVFPCPPSKMAEYNAKTGGLVDPPKDIRTLVVLDCREKDGSQLTNHLAAVRTQLGLKAEIRKATCGAADDLWVLATKAKSDGAGAVVVLVERNGLPVLTTFPEDAVSYVNVLTLQEGVEYSQYRRRLVKELWRGIGFAIGGYANPMYKGSCMQPVFSLSDLDAVSSWALIPPQINAISMVKSKLKLYNPNPVPYSRAVREGWAPAPTNDVQRSLYQRFSDPTSRFKTELGM